MVGNLGLPELQREAHGEGHEAQAHEVVGFLSVPFGIRSCQVALAQLKPHVFEQLRWKKICHYIGRHPGRDFYCS